MLGSGSPSVTSWDFESIEPGDAQHEVAMPHCWEVQQLKDKLAQVEVRVTICASVSAN